MRAPWPLLIGLLFSCGGSMSNECVTGLPSSCSALYQPTFDQVYQRTLIPTCALGAQCHGAASQGRNGGLFYTDPDQAYALLTGKTDGRARVSPGNPACSIMIERLEASDPARVMPPGQPLSAAELCAIRTWIQNGAAR
jgi:hypothetical protein